MFILLTLSTYQVSINKQSIVDDTIWYTIKVSSIVNNQSSGWYNLILEHDYEYYLNQFKHWSEWNTISISSNKNYRSTFFARARISGLDATRIQPLACIIFCVMNIPKRQTKKKIKSWKKWRVGR